MCRPTETKYTVELGSLIWVQEDRNGTPPPAVIFNTEDDDECRSVVNGYYEDALGSYKGSVKTQEKLNADFTKILDLQKKFKVELVNNKEFTAWASTPDDGIPLDPNGPIPAFDDKMIESWGLWYDETQYASPLRTVEDMEAAIRALYWWREFYDWE